jgi:ATP-dependent RNA helicase RhlE
MSFKDLGLNDKVLEAIQPLGYTEPTPIQEQSIPIVLEGKDLLGCAQTGTGKTAAFALPIVHVLSSRAPKSKGSRKPIRGIIISPTRELTSQIDENLRKYCASSSLRTTVIYGGVPQRRQVDALRRGVDIVVATPGRLLDLCNQGHVHLDNIEFLVLDEADTMLDMGFLPDIKKVIKMCPADRQTLFFSATMPDNIVSLSSSILTDPVRVQIEAVSSAADTVDQKVYYVRQSDKKDLLVDLLESDEIQNALIFTRTKFGADKVVRHLQNNNITAEAIHGNKSQPARERALNKFRKGRVRVLVATDIASRGIDVDELSHVINFELPNLAESYVHRIGRTGRAGRTGVAISFCNEGEERNHLRGIQKLIGREIELITDTPFNMPMEPVGMDYKGSGKSFKKSRNRSGGGYGRGGGRDNRGGGRDNRGGGRDSRGSDRRNDRRDSGDDNRRGYNSSRSSQPSRSFDRSSPRGDARSSDGPKRGYKAKSDSRDRSDSYRGRSENRGRSDDNRGRSDDNRGRSDNRDRSDNYGKSNNEGGYKGSSFGPSNGRSGGFSKPKFKGNQPKSNTPGSPGKKKSSFNKKRR